MSAPDSLTSLLAYVRLLMKPESNRYAVEPPPEHRRGYWEALCDVEDAIEAELLTSPAAPLVSPPGEPGTCATCRWFRPTEESFGICQKEPSEWPMHWRETWPQFGCIGHTPIEVQEALPTHLGELRDGWEASLVVTRIENGRPVSELAWVCELCGHQQGTPHHETCPRVEAPPSAPPPAETLDDGWNHDDVCPCKECNTPDVAAEAPAETREPECWCGLDEALARGDRSGARYDIVCPKHDGDTRTPEKSRPAGA